MEATHNRLSSKSIFLWLCIWLPLLTITSSWILVHVFLLVGLIAGSGVPKVVWPNKKHKINPPVWTLSISLLVTIVLYKVWLNTGVANLLPSLLGQ